ncbi:MAG TPA: hypothetical protein VFW59_01110 [Gallionella sp.]|nr:hypothetical protein [Gallionella sp.]
MQEFAKFYDSLHVLVSDGEVKAAIREEFFRLGLVANVERFFGLFGKDKRYFLVRFATTDDAIRTANQYKLRSFGFYGVLIELRGEHGSPQ